MLLAFSNNGAANIREDEEGEKVIKDGWGDSSKGKGIIVGFLTTASAPLHMHFSKSTIIQNIY